MLKTTSCVFAAVPVDWTAIRVHPLKDVARKQHFVSVIALYMQVAILYVIDYTRFIVLQYKPAPDKNVSSIVMYS